MKNELARLTGISLCLAEIPAKRAVFFSYDSSSPLAGLKTNHLCMISIKNKM